MVWPTMSTSSRRGARPYRRKRAELYCGTATAYCEGCTAWPACLSGVSPKARLTRSTSEWRRAACHSIRRLRERKHPVQACHSVRQAVVGQATPPDLRRASACPYGADVGAGSLASTASSITGHVDFVSRPRSILLLTACGSGLGRSYVANVY